MEYRYVLTVVRPAIGFDEEDMPAGTGQPEFGTNLKPASQAAISAALPDLDLQFVDDDESIKDPNRPGGMGCKRYLDDASLLEFAAPRSVAGRDMAFIVIVNLDHGCHGVTYMLEVAPAGDRFEVTGVLRESDWTV